MCNSSDVLLGICGLSGPRMFGNCSAFQAVQSTIDRAVLGVRVAHDHLQATVSRELLEGLDVGPRFGEAGDARVPEGVASTASSRATDASSLSSISCAKDRPDCEAAPADAPVSHVPGPPRPHRPASSLFGVVVRAGTIQAASTPLKKRSRSSFLWKILPPTLIHPGPIPCLRHIARVFGARLTYLAALLLSIRPIGGR